MSTKKFNLLPTEWTQVSNAAALVELGRTCKRVFVTTGLTLPDITEEAYHSLSSVDARTFTYGGGHNVYARMDKQEGHIIVTGDDLT